MAWIKSVICHNVVYIKELNYVTVSCLIPDLSFTQKEHSVPQLEDIRCNGMSYTLQLKGAENHTVVLNMNKRNHCDSSRMSSYPISRQIL